ncbi:MAG TPA: BrnA antitoxin family protein [Thermoanaerobaculia bacterium]|nr:BrnA antitoxin family protein [Thermoanaerobaculia bacterium]HQR66501.1 BrnA antitoxin family protein [Thermoanaerobaculia bacterium]
MRKHYDFSKARPNPYARMLKRQVTLRLDEPTVAYFKSLAQETAIPYQTLINLYLRECAASKKHLHLAWGAGHKAGAA